MDGGTPPLGYQPDGRSLAIVEEHATLIRDIYARYQQLGNVRAVTQALIEAGIRSPERVNGKGRAYGGCTFTRGQLYHLLKNPIYAGDIPHKGRVFPGNQPAIIERSIWEAVQAQLDGNRQGHHGARETRASLLAGLLFDTRGEPLVSVHASKPVLNGGKGGKVRYRYYVSRALHHGIADEVPGGLRLPAREIEQVVKQEIAALFSDPFGLIERCGLPLRAADLPAVTSRCAELEAALNSGDSILLRSLIKRVVLHPDRIVLELSVEVLAARLGLSDSNEQDLLIHIAAVRLTRTGRAVRMVQSDGAPLQWGTPAPSAVRLLLQARRWWQELAKGELNIKQLAVREDISSSYMIRVVRLAFLSPALVEGILSGKAAALDRTAMLTSEAIPAAWDEQANAYLPAHRHDSGGR